MVSGCCSEFEPWPGTLCCCFLSNKFYSQCPSPPRCTGKSTSGGGGGGGVEILLVVS